MPLKSKRTKSEMAVSKDYGNAEADRMEADADFESSNLNIDEGSRLTIKTDN
jgi:hypothetical protein